MAPCPAPPREPATRRANRGPWSCFVEPNDAEIVQKRGQPHRRALGDDLIVCEGRSGKTVRLIGITPEGQRYTFAHHISVRSSPGRRSARTGRRFVVNIQGPGLTPAITGRSGVGVRFASQPRSQPTPPVSYSPFSVLICPSSFCSFSCSFVSANSPLFWVDSSGSHPA